MNADREIGSKRTESEGDKRLRMNQYERNHPWSKLGFGRTTKPNEAE